MSKLWKERLDAGKGLNTSCETEMRTEQYETLTKILQEHMRYFHIDAMLCNFYSYSTELGKVKSTAYIDLTDRPYAEKMNDKLYKDNSKWLLSVK